MKSNELHTFDSEDWKTIESQFMKLYSPTFEFVSENKGSLDEAKDIYVRAFIYYTQLIEIKGVKLFEKADQIIYSFARRLWLHKLEKRRVDLNYVKHRREFFEMEEAFYEIDSIAERSARTAERLAEIGEPCRTLVLEFVGRKKPLMDAASRLGFSDEDRAFQQVTKCIRKLINLTENVELKLDEPRFTGLMRYVLDDMDRDSSAIMENNKVVIAMISRAVAMVRNYVNSSERTQVLKDIQDKMVPSVLESALSKPKVASNSKKMKPLSLIAASGVLAVVVSAITAFSVAGSMHAQDQAANDNIAPDTASVLLVDTIETAPAPANSFVGTAFAISSQGFFVTAASALEGATGVRLVHPETGQSGDATIAFTDTESDVAVLHIAFEDGSIVPYRLSPTKAGIGEALYSLGYTGEEVFYTDGSLGGSSAAFSKVGFKSGSVGAPVISANGQVVGMINAKESEVAAHCTMVNVDQIAKTVGKLAESQGLAIQLPQRNKLFYSDKARQIEQVRPFLYRVEAVYN